MFPANPAVQGVQKRGMPYFLALGRFNGPDFWRNVADISEVFVGSLAGFVGALEQEWGGGSVRVVVAGGGEAKPALTQSLMTAAQ